MLNPLTRSQGVFTLTHHASHPQAPHRVITVALRTFQRGLGKGDAHLMLPLAIWQLSIALAAHSLGCLIGIRAAGVAVSSPLSPLSGSGRVELAQLRLALFLLVHPTPMIPVAGPGATPAHNDAAWIVASER